MSRGFRISLRRIGIHLPPWVCYPGLHPFGYFLSLKNMIYYFMLQLPVTARMPLWKCFQRLGTYPKSLKRVAILQGRAHSIFFCTEVQSQSDRILHKHFISNSLFRQYAVCVHNSFTSLIFYSTHTAPLKRNANASAKLLYLCGLAFCYTLILCESITLFSLNTILFKLYFYHHFIFWLP